MRVVLNCVTDMRKPDGAAVYAVNLVRELAAIRGLDVCILVAKGQAGHFPTCGSLRLMELAVPPRPSAWQWILQPYIWLKVKRLKPDIYHLPNSLPLLCKPCKTLITIHDLVDLRVPKYSRLRTWYRRCTNWIAARRADSVITVSKSSKADIVALLGISEQKVNVIYNGVAPRYRPMAPVENAEFLREKYGIAGPFVLGVGGWQGNKDFASLFAAMTQMWKKGQVAGLVILGNGSPLQHDFKERLRSSPFGERVLLPGYVPEEELPAFYGAAEFVVYPTLYEGFGLPAVESMACGAPLITFRTSSLPEVVGDAAVLVACQDRQALAEWIERLLGDRPMRQAFRERGLKQAERFRWEETAAETCGLYRQLLGEAATARLPAGTEEIPPKGRKP